MQSPAQLYNISNHLNSHLQQPIWLTSNLVSALNIFWVGKKILIIMKIKHINQSQNCLSLPLTQKETADLLITQEIIKRQLVRSVVSQDLIERRTVRFVGVFIQINPFPSHAEVTPFMRTIFVLFKAF